MVERRKVIVQSAGVYVVLRAQALHIMHISYKHNILYVIALETQLNCISTVAKAVDSYVHQLEQLLIV
jgi:hypothetical protein